MNAFARLPRLALAAALALPLAAQDVATDGYALAPLPYPGYAATATLSNGDVVSFDGWTVDRWDAAGNHVLNLASFALYAYPSFVVVDPGETFAVIAESQSGNLFTLPLTGGGATPLALLPFNYGAAFESPTSLVVSAALCGFGCGNDLVRVDLATGAITTLAQVAGPSGPVVFDAFGNLVYATVAGGFPPPPASTDVLFWTPAQLASGLVLDESDATLLGTGFDGASSLAIDPVREHVYLAETNFGVPTNRIVRVNGLAVASPVVVVGDAGQAVSNLEFDPGDGVATFDPFQPASGGTLRFNETDFYSTWTRTAVVTARPALSLAGPGASGAGAFTVELAGFPRLGIAFLVYGPSSAFGAEVPVTTSSSPPLFTGFAPGGTYVHPVAVAIDANGVASVPFVNDGSLVGLVAIQGLAYELGATSPIGTSVPAFL